MHAEVHSKKKKVVRVNVVRVNVVRVNVVRVNVRAVWVGIRELILPARRKSIRTSRRIEYTRF